MFFSQPKSNISSQNVSTEAEVIIIPPSNCGGQHYPMFASGYINLAAKLRDENSPRKIILDLRNIDRPNFSMNYMTGIAIAQFVANGKIEVINNHFEPDYSKILAEMRNNFRFYVRYLLQGAGSLETQNRYSQMLLHEPYVENTAPKTTDSNNDVTKTTKSSDLPYVDDCLGFIQSPWG